MKVGLAYNSFYSSIESFLKFSGEEIKFELFNKSNKYDLVVFSGGEDICPAYYEQKNTASSYTKRRDEIEFEVFQSATYKGIPIFGICRGLQLINVALGGDLFQDLYINTGTYHRSVHKISGGGIFTSVLEKINFTVNSLHHQGIDHLSHNLNCDASWKNIPEIVSGIRYPILAVQFHPEFMNPENQILFSKKLFEWVKKC